MEHFVRPAGPADAEGIADVQQRSWQAAYTGLLSPRSLTRAAALWDARHWWGSLERIGHPTVTLVLDGPDTGIAGFGVCGPRRGRQNPELQRFAGEIYLLYLLPSIQSRGHGTQLMAGMARVMRARGMESALVWALSGNHPAIGFYRRLGGDFLLEAARPFLGETVTETAFGWPDLTAVAECRAAPRSKFKD